MTSYKKPNFFIIGTPKCGTTSLSKYLSEHPDVFFSKPKEIGYFDDDLKGSNKWTFKNIEAYLKIFNDSINYKAVGEGSVSYLFSKNAVRNIIKFNPLAKFIVMIRNPIEMAQSAHSQLIINGNEVEMSFEKAWRLQESRKVGKNIPKYCIEPKELQYGEMCKLGAQIERLFKFVKPSNVLIIAQDEFKKDPRAVYLKVLNFLDLKDDGKKKFPFINKNKKITRIVFFKILHFFSFLKKKLNIRIRLGLLNKLTSLNEKINTIEMSRDKINKKLYNELKEYFRNDVVKLSRYYKKDLTYWLK